MYVLMRIAMASHIEPVYADERIEWNEGRVGNPGEGELHVCNNLYLQVMLLFFM